MGNKRMTVCAFTDKGGTMGQTQQQEYDNIKKSLQEIVFPDVDLEFRQDVPPHELPNNTFDVYIFDYGGALVNGDEEYILGNYYRPLLKVIEDNPSKLFLIWSSYTQLWYTRLIEDESPELKVFNVLLMEWRDDEIKKARAFCGLTPEFSSEAYWERQAIKPPKIETPKGMRPKMEK